MGQRKSILNMAREGISTYGLYVSLADPTIIELAVKAGYDFARIDWEHTLFDHQTLTEMFRTARLLDFPLQIRMGSLDHVCGILALEPGAVMCSHMDDAAAAEQFVRSVKYGPLGERGMYGFTRAVRFGNMTREEYLSCANENIHTIVQIESRQGLENLEQIAAVNGVDMIATGKADLSQALGVAGQTTHPSVIEAENYVIETAVRHHKIPVVMCDSPQRMAELEQKGVHCFVLGFDESLCLQAFREKLLSVTGRASH